MNKKRIFQIRSKKDAGYLAVKIKQSDSGFHYYLPLMGVTGGMTSITWYPKRKKYTMSSSAPGWQNHKETSMRHIVEYLWKDRKLINAELRHVEPS
jgi:tryptophan synthase alpha subunit